MVPGRPVQRRGYVHWVLKDEQKFSRPRRQKGTGTRTDCSISRGWWLGGLGRLCRSRAVSLGKRGVGVEGTVCRSPGSWAAADPGSWIPARGWP